MNTATRDPAKATPSTRANRRTGLILLSIALVFFGGIIAAQYAGGTTVGIVVLGFGILGFLYVAVERGRASRS